MIGNSEDFVNLFVVFEKNTKIFIVLFQELFLVSDYEKPSFILSLYEIREKMSLIRVFCLVLLLFDWIIIVVNLFKVFIILFVRLLIDIFEFSFILFQIRTRFVVFAS